MPPAMIQGMIGVRSRIVRLSSETGWGDWVEDFFIVSDEVMCGDINGDLGINILDITSMIDYLYREGPEPFRLESADVNSDGNLNILDVTYLVNYLYRDGPDPDCP